jgi:hypothetical protein
MFQSSVHAEQKRPATSAYGRTMNRQRLLPLALVVLCTTPMLVAQAFIEPSAGSRLMPERLLGSYSGPWPAQRVPLGFSFPMPGGEIVDAVIIDAYGRILPGSSDRYNELPDLDAFATQRTPMIAACWTPIVFGSVFFDRVAADRAVVSWIDTEGGDGNPFTMQVQIDGSDGSVTILFDSRLPANVSGYYVNDERPMLVGLSDGITPPIDAATDLSSADLQTSSGGSVFEAFDHGFAPTARALDLQSTAIRFTPTPTGTYTTTVTTGIPDPDFLTAEAFGFYEVPGGGRSACDQLRFAITATPDGSGGYIVSNGGEVALPSPQSSPAPWPGYLDWGHNGFTAPMLPVTLPFPFPMPGGQVVQALDVDQNGRVTVAGTSTPDTTPTIEEFLQGPPTIAPFWRRGWTPPSTSSLGPRSGIYVDSTPSSVTISWLDSRDYYRRDSEPHAVSGISTPPWTDTFQLRLFADGSFQMLYPDTDYSAWGILGASYPDSAPSDVLVGFTGGGGVPDPGEANMRSILAGTTTTAGSTFYEYWENHDRTEGDGWSMDDRAGQWLRLQPVTTPALGAPFRVVVSDRRGSTQDAVVFLGLRTGIFAPAVDLSPLSPLLAGCRILTDVVTPGAVVSARLTPIGVPVELVQVSSDPLLLGVDAMVVSALGFTLDDLPILAPTDELVLRFGAY